MKFKINKSGAFYWKPQIVPHRSSMGSFKYITNDTSTKEEIFQVKHFWVTSCVQIFFLKWIFSITDLIDDKGMCKNATKYRQLKENKPQQAICEN